MPKPKSPQEWLTAFKDELVRRNATIRAIDLTKLGIDKRARTLEAEWAEIYVSNRPALIEVLDALGICEKDWCRKLGPGFSYSTVRRRIQLFAGLDHYLRRRPKVSDKFNLEYAVSLARPEKPEIETNSRRTRTQIAGKAPSSDPDHLFITSWAHLELPKLLPRSVQVCITSPPYWPLRRLYDMLADGTILSPTPDTIGFEPTFEAYLDHVVRRDFRQLKPVLRDDGVVFVIIDDVIANPSSIYDEQTYHSRRAKMKLRSQVGPRTQDTTKMRPKGNWLGLVGLFAAAIWFAAGSYCIAQGH